MAQWISTLKWVEFVVGSHVALRFFFPPVFLPPQNPTLLNSNSIWAELLEAWLALTSVKYHDNILILILLNQWLALTMLRTTGPWMLNV